MKACVGLRPPQAGLLIGPSIPPGEQFRHSYHHNISSGHFKDINLKVIRDYSCEPTASQQRRRLNIR